LSCSLPDAVPAADLGPAWASPGALFVEMLDAHADTAIGADGHRSSLIVVTCAFVAVHRDRCLLIRWLTPSSNGPGSSGCSTPQVRQPRITGPLDAKGDMGTSVLRASHAAARNQTEAFNSAERRSTRPRRDQATSNRSRLITLSHAATKSRTNISLASSHA
jgi:hypothetical protein